MSRKTLFRTLILTPLLCVTISTLSAHSGKARYHVIIDTDCAADDQRAICMLLGNREVEVLAITTSEGALSPRQGARRVRELLEGLHHEGIEVGVGRTLNITAPRWRKHSEQIVWSATTTHSPLPTPLLSPLPTDTSGKKDREKKIRYVNKTMDAAREVITRHITAEEQPVTFVALGALTNLADVLNDNPSLGSRIEKVVWYNDAAAPQSGANYQSDPAAARQILNSGLNIEMISERDERPFMVSEALLDSLLAIGTPHAHAILASHTVLPLSQLIEEQHLLLWDDLVVLTLLRPELFVRTPMTLSSSWIASDTPADTPADTLLPSSTSIMIPHDTLSLNHINGALAEIVRGKPDSESRVFFGFPTSVTLYADDVAPIIAESLLRHGASEWRAAVLTNELHGHLGIYATIGVKMGIRAREYFNIGVDDIRVLSHAGSTPPVSCLNDGLQVATGATLGHGLIEVATHNPQKVRPAAQFTFKNQSIIIALKPRLVTQIKRDIQRGINIYGNLTEEYWNYVRSLALMYWLEWDRHDIFDLYPVNQFRY